MLLNIQYKEKPSRIKYMPPKSNAPPWIPLLKQPSPIRPCQFQQSPGRSQQDFQIFGNKNTKIESLKILNAPKWGFLFSSFFCVITGILRQLLHKKNWFWTFFWPSEVYQKNCRRKGAFEKVKTLAPPLGTGIWGCQCHFWPPLGRPMQSKVSGVNWPPRQEVSRCLVGKYPRWKDPIYES